MSDARAPSEVPARNRRLQQLLDQLAQQGTTQQQVARQLNVPASYLSDVKLGRKTLSDSFARAFCQQFGVGLDWLLDGRGPQTKPQLAAAGASAGPVLVPIFSQLILGDPQQERAWDGSRVELSGPAAAAALCAEHPYVLRCPVDDKRGRLRQHDLILIDQSPQPPTSLVVLRDGGHLLLAWQRDSGYRSLESGRAIRGQPALLGVCRGLVWARF